MTFDEVFKDAYDYWIDDTNIHRYEGAKGLAEQVWQHQQAKVEGLQDVERTLQGRSAALQDKINGLQEQVDDLDNRATQYAFDEMVTAKLNAELQKRVDAAIQEIKGATRWVDEDAIDDPDFIKGGVLAAFARLEQALKGEGQ